MSYPAYITNSADYVQAARDYEHTLAWVNGIRALGGFPPLDALPDDDVPFTMFTRVHNCPLARALGDFGEVIVGGEVLLKHEDQRRIVAIPAYVKRTIEVIDRAAGHGVFA